MCFYQEKVAIYGIFSRRRCLYVGQTINPKMRRSPHRFRFPHGKFRILRWVLEKDANRIEAQIIQRYWARGQAKHNKTLRGTFNRGPCGEPVKISGIRKIFRDPQTAARFLGCRTPAILKGIKTGQSVIGWTLDRFVKVRYA